MAGACAGEGFSAISQFAQGTVFVILGGEEGEDQLSSTRHTRWLHDGLGCRHRLIFRAPHGISLCHGVQYQRYLATRPIREGKDRSTKRKRRRRQSGFW